MEEQGLVVVKENFLVKMTNAFKKLFGKNKIENITQLTEIDNIPKQVESGENVTNKIDFEEISNDNQFVQKEIIDARKAFRKYVINNNKNISADILTYIKERVKENQSEIEQLMIMNNDNISYEELLQMIENEIKDVSKYKHRNSKTGRYNVPIGVVGIECSTIKETVKAIFKSISTRNAVMILEQKYNKYSTEALVLLIVKESLKNFYIDDNIIQIFEKQEIDLSKLDRYVPKKLDESTKKKDVGHTIYIYQENEKYQNQVQNEIQRLESNDEFKSFEIKPIKGEFGNIINFLNSNKSQAVCMYTDNSQKAYKFINWINSPNVFINTGIQTCKKINNISDYYNAKYVLHEGVF
ncbi:MAG: hypothetical protein K6B70_00600 [Clostridia bacterium]|nr:hypothetical protein [Clostridia bacterium]